VPSGPGDIQLATAALASVCQSNALAMLDDPDSPCCSQCAGLEHREPSESDHRSGNIAIRGYEDVVASGGGTCAELAAIDAGAQNARLLAARTTTSARTVVLEDARGPGRHHVIVQKSDGSFIDPAALEQEGCSCS